jgi:glutamine amidotransferase
VIAIIDYNMGNLWSVYNAFRKLGAEAELVNEPGQLAKASALVLPGVGSFDQGMDNLDQLGLSEIIRARTLAGVPFLGFCLGMQVLFSDSEEGRQRPGLDLIKGQVKKLPPGNKVPHMGWNPVRWLTKDPLVAELPAAPHMYFAHSYYCEPQDKAVVLGTTGYTTEFASAVAKKRIYATQFHPEKSGDTGLELLANFIKLSKLEA